MRSEPTQTDGWFETLMPGKKNQHKLRRWERRVVVLGWEGRGNEPNQANAGFIITGKEQNHRFR